MRVFIVRLCGVALLAAGIIAMLEDKHRWLPRDPWIRLGFWLGAAALVTLGAWAIAHDAPFVVQRPISSVESQNVTPVVKHSPAYFVSTNGQTAGPLSLEQLRSYWLNGRLDANTLYWFSGADGWRPISQLRPLLGPLRPYSQNTGGMPR